MTKYKAKADIIATNNGFIEYDEEDRFSRGEKVEIIKSVDFSEYFEIHRDGFIIGMNKDELDRWFEVE